jgi:hypothetical protein
MKYTKELKIGDKIGAIVSGKLIQTTDVVMSKTDKEVITAAGRTLVHHNGGWAEVSSGCIPPTYTLIVALT